MATVADIEEIRQLDVDFIELLIRMDDEAEQIGKVLEARDREMIVHAPERMRLENEPKLIDLADTSSVRRNAYVKRIAEVVGVAESYGIPTVVHPGGVLDERASDATALKDNLIESLNAINGRMWIENMPRGYHSGEILLHPHLLLHPEDFDDVLDLVDGVTLDVCHAYLSVDRGGNGAIAAFFDHLKNHIRHVHLSDASYPHHEGLPLGEGDIDMAMLPRMRGLPVLLEVWGGHLNGMAGYKRAIGTVKGADWFKGCVP
jgi:sugar phosphate isomerase/epimerase